MLPQGQLWTAKKQQPRRYRTVGRELVGAGDDGGLSSEISRGEEFSPVQEFSRSVVSDSWRPHEP